MGAETLLKKDIRKTKEKDLAEALAAAGHPKFRLKQIQEWLWMKQAADFGQMTNLPQPMREWLDSAYAINGLEVATAQKSNDGTVKSGFRLFDGELVEGVLIPADDRMTACVSSQVGCSLTCKFCATGYMDRKRNLEAFEIFDQVVAIRKQAEEHFGTPLTNIVYMGMGEPLLNYANVLESVERITSPQGLGMAAKRITVSTAGIAKMIKKLGDDEVRFRLALSLHAANDAKRNQIMPINESNTLENLGEALNHFYDKTGNRITFEYIVFHGFNDNLSDVEELYRFARQVPSRINIIEYNPISEAAFVNAKGDRIEMFRDYLESRGVTVNVRRSRGKDIDAACGQLAVREKGKAIAHSRVRNEE